MWRGRGRGGARRGVASEDEASLARPIGNHHSGAHAPGEGGGREARSRGRSRGRSRIARARRGARRGAPRDAPSDVLHRVRQVEALHPLEHLAAQGAVRGRADHPRALRHLARPHRRAHVGIGQRLTRRVQLRRRHVETATFAAWAGRVRRQVTRPRAACLEPRSTPASARANRRLGGVVGFDFLGASRHFDVRNGSPLTPPPRRLLPPHFPPSPFRALSTPSPFRPAPPRPRRSRPAPRGRASAGTSRT